MLAEREKDKEMFKSFIQRLALSILELVGYAMRGNLPLQNYLHRYIEHTIAFKELLRLYVEKVIGDTRRITLSLMLIGV